MQKLQQSRPFLISESSLALNQPFFSYGNVNNTLGLTKDSLNTKMDFRSISELGRFKEIVMTLLKSADLSREWTQPGGLGRAVPIKDVNIGQLLLAINELLRTYLLRLPPDLLIMVKALVTAEGTARQIYPELDIISEAEEYVGKLAAERYNVETLWKNIRSTVSQMFSLQWEIPTRFTRIADKL